MSIIKPFKAIRPQKNLAKLVAALPYDVMSSEEAYEMAKDNSYSFLHVDKAEIDLPKGTDLYSQIVYDKAAMNLKNMIKDKVLVKEEKDSLYIYRLIMNGKAQIGLVACASIDDYLNNIIKKHELTREEKEIDRIKHVDNCNANTGPIFLTHRKNENINSILYKKIQEEPEYDFTEDDGVRHTVWVIKDENTINDLVSIFKNEIKCLYIADGHHRAASAVKVGLKRRKEKVNYTGNEEFNYFLSVIFPENELYIMDYNRIVKDLNGLSKEEFLDKLKANFIVEEIESGENLMPIKSKTYSMYVGGKWYRLESKESTYSNLDSIGKLDVSILQNSLLSPILGIGDPRKDDRIDFVGGIRGIEYLKERVDKEGGVAFAMFPTTLGELMNIADENKIMPPKSTWFEPKLRSGLFIHDLE